MLIFLACDILETHGTTAHSTTFHPLPHPSRNMTSLETNPSTISNKVTVVSKRRRASMGQSVLMVDMGLEDPSGSFQVICSAQSHCESLGCALCNYAHIKKCDYLSFHRYCICRQNHGLNSVMCGNSRCGGRHDAVMWTPTKVA
jgi:hypothetical protein